MSSLGAVSVTADEMRGISLPPLTAVPPFAAQSHPAHSPVVLAAEAATSRSRLGRTSSGSRDGEVSTIYRRETLGVNRPGPATMPVKLPVFCLVACVRMRYFTCAHQPALTGSVMWWEPFVTDSLAPASSRGAGPESRRATEPVSRKTSVWMAQAV